MQIYNIAMNIIYNFYFLNVRINHKQRKITIERMSTQGREKRERN